MATVADVLAQTIRDAGIETVFGLPGGENVVVLDAFRRHRLEFILVRNESSGVFMADATARLTGKPSVALTTLGPGAANAYCGLAHADLDRGPVLLVTAQSDGTILDRYTHQVIDLQSAFAPVTKMTRELTTRDTRQTVQEALRLTMAGRPGPVHLGISSDMAGQAVLGENDGGNRAANPSAPVPAAADVEAARQFLARARHPLIVVGLGAEPEKPYDAIRRLAEAAQAPVITTPKAKGAISDRHRLAAGTFGLTQTDPPYQLADESDCIVAVGFGVVEMERLWDQPQPIIWVAPWQNEDPTVATVEHELVGEMAPILERLTRVDFDHAPDWGEGRIATFRAERDSGTLPEPAPGHLRPQTVIDVLRQNIPDETVLATDVGSHKIAAARVTGALTICLTGDGGMHMVMGQLGVLRALDLPVIVVVLNDNALDLIRSAQLRRGNPVYGTEFENPDYEHVARSFDIDFYRAGDPAAIEKAIRVAVGKGRAAVVEALIDPASYPTTP